MGIFIHIEYLISQCSYAPVHALTHIKWANINVQAKIKASSSTW